jgi:hypothetical protein
VPVLTASQCDGVRPRCSACETRDTDCRYGETEARQIRRRYEDLKGKRTAHEELFDMLSTMSEQDAADVFRRIRSGANAEALVRHVQEGSLVLGLSLGPETRTRFEFPYRAAIPAALRESIYFRSHVFDAIQLLDPTSASALPANAIARQSNYARPFFAAEMVDPLLADARPSQWTQVSSNDLLLRKLLEGYFMFEYSWNFIFHKDYFLEDMVSGGTRFCSSLLVNALLAKACVSDLVPVSRRPTDVLDLLSDTTQQHQLLGPRHACLSLPRRSQAPVGAGRQRAQADYGPRRMSHQCCHGRQRPRQAGPRLCSQRSSYGTGAWLVSRAFDR